MNSAEFDPADPFPRADGCTHAEAREHARLVDDWLGLAVAATEARLAAEAPIEGQQRWIGYDPQTFLTPYIELREILEALALPAGARVADLGAGYGRMGFVIARHRPDLAFVGYELVDARVAEGSRALAGFVAPLGTDAPAELRLVRADLAAPDFTPPSADAYFIYDYGTRAAIAKTLEDLRTRAREQPVTVVGRGRATRDAIEREHPWLSQVVAPEHRGNFSVYRTA